MNRKNTQLIFATLATVLLAANLFKLDRISMETNISGLVLGGFIILGIVIGSLILAWLLRLFFKTLTFWSTFFIFFATALAAFLVYLFVVNS